MGSHWCVSKQCQSPGLTGISDVLYHATPVARPGYGREPQLRQQSIRSQPGDAIKSLGHIQVTDYHIQVPRSSEIHLSRQRGPGIHSAFSQPKPKLRRAQPVLLPGSKVWPSHCGPQPVEHRSHRNGPHVEWRGWARLIAKRDIGLRRSLWPIFARCAARAAQTLPSKEVGAVAKQQEPSHPAPLQPCSSFDRGPSPPEGQ